MYLTSAPLWFSLEALCSPLMTRVKYEHAWKVVSTSSTRSSGNRVGATGKHSGFPVKAATEPCATVEFFPTKFWNQARANDSRLRSYSSQRHVGRPNVS